MNIQEALTVLVQQQDLNQEQMTAVMRCIMNGEATDAQIAAFLMAMRIKGETVTEITAAVQVMRELAIPVHVQAEHLVDTCGTGGDGANLFNVSTAAAFVVAACGGHVAKHGNRSASSATGSADLLEAAGISLILEPDAIARAIRDIGVGFMFAQVHHKAMKYTIGPRKELGIRTLFNFLGPMLNPARVKRQVIGVFDADVCLLMAQVLKNLGSEHVLVVHSNDGLDELSLAAPTRVAELRNGEITEYQVSPEDLGLKTQSLQGLTVSNVSESLVLIKNALGDRNTVVAQKAANMIALNAAAALYVSGITADLTEGVKMADDAICSGLAREKMKELAAFCDVLN